MWLVAGLWVSLGTPVSSTNKTDNHDIIEILLIVALNIMTHKLTPIISHNVFDVMFHIDRCRLHEISHIMYTIIKMMTYIGIVL